MWAPSSTHSRAVLPVLLLAAFTAGAGQARAQLRVAAAADLAQAFQEVGVAFERHSGHKVTFSFGSTGLLTKQLEQGAPFDILAAADVAYADQLVREGICASDSKVLYARGRLVVWTRHGTGLQPPKSLADLQDPRFRKVAIANPAHAPYGRAAMQALERAGVLAAVKGRLVFGENVQQALQFAQSGNAEAAVVALSLAGAADGTALPVDPALHAPIDQAMVACGKDPERLRVAREFSVFVNSAEGRRIMRRFGFLLSGELALGKQ